MDLIDFDALSFDCYGTLVDWEAGILAVLRPWASRRGLAVDDDALLGAFGEHESAEEAADPSARYPVILDRTMRALGRALGAEVDEADAEALATSVPDWPAFPDSAAALASLATRYKLIILSNVDRQSFRGSNERLGITFDAVVTAEDVGSYKPSARNFEALLSTAADLGVRPGTLLHVAQSLFHDHVPAHAAGLPTVWIDRRVDRDGWGATPPPATAVEPDWTFDSMRSFADAAVPRR